MGSATFDPERTERVLHSIATLWTISLVYAGINRPIDVGPVAIHLTLWALVGPFLLLRLYRLEESTPGPDAQRGIRRALLAGVVSYGSGVLWGDTATALSLAAEVVALTFFAGAMALVAGAHEAPDIADRWRRLRRLAAALGLCWLPAMVLVIGDFELSRWLRDAPTAAGALSAAIVLVRLAAATTRTRSWLRGLAARTS